MSKVDYYLDKAADCETRGKWLAAEHYFKRALEAEEGMRGNVQL